MKISKDTAEHYVWREVCDGWHLLKAAELSVIQERMPVKTSEVRHFHTKARQFFFMLAGRATLEVQGEIVVLGEGEGIEVAHGVSHQMINNSGKEVEFIVVSTPPSHGDRVVAE